jgi:hypothetical protein
MRRPDFGMSEPQYFEEPFDDGLAALFNRAARETDDAGFTDALFQSLERRGRIRLLALTGAGVVGGLIAASQFGAIAGMYAGKAQGAWALLEAAMTSQASAGSSAAAVLVAGVCLLALLTGGGALALGRR